MKKLVLLFSLSLAFSFSSKGQTSVYHPFPDSNAFWNCSYGGSCSTMVYFNHDYTYTIIGDTIINSFNYHKLWVPAVVITDQCGINDIQSGYYAGAYRQDIPNKAVYYVPSLSSVETLLYDFKLNVGDTLKSYGADSCYHLGGNFYKIATIDSILIGNSYRKRFNYDNLSNTFLIEGIGDAHGLLEPICFCFESCYGLRCFKQDSVTLYPYSSFTCSIITSTNNLSQKNISITLSPNPFHTTATLEIKGLTPNPSPKERGEELRIYDVMGRLVQSQIINPENSGSTIINRDGLGDGLYFYQLRTNNYELIATGKFVVD